MPRGPYKRYEYDPDVHIPEQHRITNENVNIQRSTQRSQR